jgi:beta-lactamase regulating signal transducer with metallopeptidase domain
MNGWAAWLEGLGRHTVDAVWEPVLVWTALALAGWAFLSFLRKMHPVLHERTRGALMLALPVSVLVALLGQAGWVPVPRRPVPIASAWVAAHDVGLAAALVAERAGTTPAGGDSASVPITFWLGCLLILALLASVVFAVKWAFDRIALGRLQSRLRLVNLSDLVDPNTLSRNGLGPARAVRFAVAPDDVVPMTFGILRPVIVVPSTLLDDPAGLRMALEHELAHVGRGDALFHVLEHLVALVFALHPLVHLLRGEIHRFREMACDSEVLARGRCRPRDYAAALCRLAEPVERRPVALGMSVPFTHLKRRVVTMNTRRHDPIQLRRAHRLGFTLGTVVLLLTIGIAACSDLISDPAVAQDDLAVGRVLFRAGDVGDALRDAEATYEGRLLVYFSGQDSVAARGVERYLFGNPEYAGFINSDFARYTVAGNSPEGLALMERYHVTSRTTAPLLLIVDDYAVLMTTLDEVASPEDAAKKMRQVRLAVGLAPRAQPLGASGPWHLELKTDQLRSFIEGGSISPGARWITQETSAKGDAAARRG